MADGSANVQAAADAAPESPQKTAKKGKKAKQVREQSTIGFPYMDLEAGIGLAAAMLKAGGVALTREQLAGVTNLSVGSGNFVTKIATARLFGLISYSQNKYELTDLGFSILDTDEKRARSARATAFLNVELYKRVYDEFKGRQLPPRPHGLEQAFVRFGVAQKQKGPARWAFDKSARQAGFFSASEDRLIEPIIGNVAPVERVRADVVIDEEEDVGLTTVTPKAASGKVVAIAKGLHPFIQGLLEALPEPGTNWAVEGRAKWLEAAARNFDLMYKGTGEIKVSAVQEDHDPKEPARKRPWLDDPNDKPA